MATYLFSAGKHSKISFSAVHKPSAIPRHLFNIVRGGNDAIDALRLFLNLLHEDELDPATPGYMAFDAHVGDTSCQLRACMLLEIFNRYRQRDSSTTEVQFIKETIEHLEKVVENALSFCKDVCNIGMSQAGPVSLGMSKHGMSIDGILQKIGWDKLETLNHSQRVSSRPPLVSFASDFTIGSTSMASSSGLSLSNSNTTASSATSISDIETGNLQETSSKIPSVVSAEASSDFWEPWDWHQVVHFLVYSYVLSKYKHFTIRPLVYGANIDPQSAFDYSHQLLDGKFPHPCQPPTKRPIEQEFAVLQSYLSDLSCSWLSSTSRLFSPDRQLMTRYVMSVGLLGPGVQADPPPKPSREVL